MKQKNKKRKNFDYSLFIAIIILVVFGLFMVYSASNVVAIYKYNDQAYFLKRQLIFACIGIALMFIIINIDIMKIYKSTYIIFIIATITLVLVLIPGIGVVRGGARSWIGIGSFSFQPAEFVKLAMILLMARLIDTLKEKIHKFGYFLLLLLIMGVSFGLIMLQPDFGTGLVLVLSTILILFCSGSPIKYFLLLGGLGLLGLVVLIISASYRMERILAFLDPWSDPLGSGFQAIQALFSIAPSGLFGLGYNNSMQKHFFLPEPQNDFIFAIVCEELGLIGGLLLIGLFLFVIIKIVIMTFKIENNYMRLILIGVATSLFVQVFINLGVVIGLLPVTGITLPIISYGGSSLVLTLVMLAIVINISQYREE